MCREFFKPNWAKAIWFLSINCLAMLLYLVAQVAEASSPGGWLQSFFTYGYILLAPFGTLLFVLADALGKMGVAFSDASVIALAITQNILDISWQFALACFAAAGISRILGRKSVIIKAKRKIRR
jgi:hypothetical protein